MEKLLSTVLGGVVLAALSASASAADPIGTIKQIRMGAYSKAPGGNRVMAYPWDRIVNDHVLETVDRGALNLRFIDDTDLTMGSNAKLVIDRMIFDPEQSDSPALTLMSGAFRLVSGAANGNPAQPVAVPHGQIGIRGTTWTAVVDPVTSSTTVTTTAGLVTVTSSVTGDTADVPAGMTISISSTGLGAPASIGFGFGATGDEAVDSVSMGGGLSEGPAGEASAGGDH